MNLIESKVHELLEKEIYPTTFELGTALAFEYFARKGVEYAVIEVGLGGRFDSTNVIMPEISMIAAIGIDHIKVLGDTVEQIAFEKAGIIKPGIPAVVQQQSENILDVFRDAASQRGCELDIAAMPSVISEDAYGSCFLLDGEEYAISLCGRHQLLNASLAITSMRKLGITTEVIKRGVSLAKWPCRLEWVSGALIDGAHNPQGAAALREYIERFFSDSEVTLVTGMMHDKQMDEVAAILAPVCTRVIATAVPDESRAALPEDLQTLYASLGADCTGVTGIEAAIESAMKYEGVKVFAGSLYIAGAVRQYLAGDNCF